MIIKRDILDTKFGNKKAKQIVCSSKQKTSKSYKQIFRSSSKNKEDPWLSYTDYADSSMMYGENGKCASVVLSGYLTIFYNCAGNVGNKQNLQKNGMNVWIYPPPSSCVTGFVSSYEILIPGCDDCICACLSGMHTRSIRNENNACIMNRTNTFASLL